MIRKILATSILVPGLFFLALQPARAAGEISAAAAGPDPWTKVPKASTTCYSGQDKYFDELGAATEAVTKEIQKQSEINNRIEHSYATLDPAQMMSKMQAYLMENPQEAVKVMQAMQAKASAITAAVPKEAAGAQKLDAELKDLEARYEAAVASSRAPFDRKMQTLFKEGQSAEEGRRDFAIQKQLYEQINAAYENLCPAWWGASGAFQAWLGRYRDHLINDRLPHLAEIDETKLTGFRIAGVDAQSYRPLGPMEAVLDYMKKAYQVMNERPGGPTGF